MKKIIKVVLIIIASIVLLGTIFGIVDYIRAKNGKKPMFTYLGISSFDVEIVGEEKGESKSNNYAVYSGLGYKIVTCDFCEKKVSFLPLGIGNYPYTTLTCTQEIAKNNKHIFEYRFTDGKLENINTTLIIPAKDIDDEEEYEKEFNKINDIKGCGGSFTKKVNLSGVASYTTSIFCDLSRMSDDNIQTVYKTDRSSLLQTKKEIINKYKDSNPTIKCKKENF